MSDVYLQRCIPDTSSGHSIPVGQLVPWYRDSQASPLDLGFQADRVGPGCRSGLRLAALKTQERFVLIDRQLFPPKCSWYLFLPGAKVFVKTLSHPVQASSVLQKLITCPVALNSTFGIKPRNLPWGVKKSLRGIVMCISTAGPFILYVHNRF